MELHRTPQLNDRPARPASNFLVDDFRPDDDQAVAAIAERLALACGEDRDMLIAHDAQGRVNLVTSPPVRRVSMAPRGWPPKARGRGRTPAERSAREDTDPSDYATRPGGVWRRMVLLTMVLAQSWFATSQMQRVLPYHGERWLELSALILFAVLFAWVSAGFWTAVMGFVQLLFGKSDSLSGAAVDPAPIPPDARTAIVMPICNEHVARSLAGLRATLESLANTGEQERFDFYILSDSSDPDARVAEVSAWLDLCRALQGQARVFYRWRRHRIKRKSGNIADFCRRWGADYRYMVVLDADSVMSGDCLAKLVRLMEAHPGTGIIQTAPRPAGRETLYARIQQFASHVYGPLFIAGLHFWQLGESHYWGHNAIIRIAPFVRHCALGRLPGRGPLSGEILSHDFVEAALMRRAGWAVWIAYDLDGSYEETPPNLVDELKRERRWCYGNLMNFRLFPGKGFHPVHRAVFMTGVIAYVSSPLWFLFLIVSTGLLATHTLSEPQYFLQPRQLFPLWPEWHPERAMALFSATAMLLFAPKLLSIALLCRQGAARFGGGLRLAVSVLGEALFSALLAPIRMLFHTQFVLAALCGRSIAWKSPPREDAETTWHEAFRRHGWHTVLGILWSVIVYWIEPTFLWWLLPVVGALTLSIPVSVISSRVSWGRVLRRLGLFLIPEELATPEELCGMSRHLTHAPQARGFVDAVVDPLTNALVCASARVRRSLPEARSALRARLVQRALRHGPAALPAAWRSALLNDPLALLQLHLSLPSQQAHPAWRSG